MDQLTDEQRTRVEVLLSHLQTFPMAELLVTSGELRTARPIGAVEKKRINQALAGAFAMEKIGSYLRMLRNVDTQRQVIGVQTHERRITSRALRASDARGAMIAHTESVHLSGLQEVTFHFFAVCVTAIRDLLPLVARASGYKIPAADRTVLNSYLPLRHYFEHLEERVPGKSRQAEVVSERIAEAVWITKIGFEADQDDRIILHGQPIDVTTRGLEAVEDVISRSYEAMRSTCLDQVREHFIQDPSDIPSPEEVPYRPLMSTFSASDDNV